MPLRTVWVWAALAVCFAAVAQAAPMGVAWFEPRFELVSPASVLPAADSWAMEPWLVFSTTPVSTLTETPRLDLPIVSDTPANDPLTNTILLVFVLGTLYKLATSPGVRSLCSQLYWMAVYINQGGSDGRP